MWCKIGDNIKVLKIVIALTFLIFSVGVVLGCKRNQKKSPWTDKHVVRTPLWCSSKSHLCKIKILFVHKLSKYFQSSRTWKISKKKMKQLVFWSVAEDAWSHIHMLEVKPTKVSIHNFRIDMVQQHYYNVSVDTRSSRTQKINRTKMKQLDFGSVTKNMWSYKI